MPTTPFWIAFGDIHDDIEALHRIPELDKALGIIVTGDITLAGGTRQAAKVFDAIAAKTPAILAQIGNMDKGEITAWLEERDWNLHARARTLFPGVTALGVGCSTFTPFGTPSEYPESKLAEWIDDALNEAKRAASSASNGRTFEEPPMPRLVLVSHMPPYGSACDRLHDGTPVGSTSVRDFIEDVQPDLCVCGHIHESRAEDFIGKTQIINPGTLGSGGYAVIRQQGEGKNMRVIAELKKIP